MKKPAYTGLTWSNTGVTTFSSVQSLVKIMMVWLDLTCCLLFFFFPVCYLLLAVCFGLTRIDVWGKSLVVQVTSLSYLVIQIPAFFFMRDKDKGGGVLALIVFVRVWCDLTLVVTKYRRNKGALLRNGTHRHRRSYVVSCWRWFDSLHSNSALLTYNSQAGFLVTLFALLAYGIYQMKNASEDEYLKSRQVCSLVSLVVLI